MEYFPIALFSNAFVLFLFRVHVLLLPNIICQLAHPAHAPLPISLNIIFFTFVINLSESYRLHMSVKQSMSFFFTIYLLL